MKIRCPNCGKIQFKLGKYTEMLDKQVCCEHCSFTVACSSWIYIPRTIKTDEVEITSYNEEENGTN